MLGQNNLLKNIDWQIEADCFPRFAIIVGARGSEKNLVVRHIADKMKAFSVELPDAKIETVRTIIEQAYRVHKRTIYCLYDADSMSVPAKNALLKVTEEPPNDAYFIMTLEDANNTLDTIRSRATIFQMERYSPKEIELYAKKWSDIEDVTIYKTLCATPGEVDMLHKVGAEDFYAYVEKVVSNVATVNGANVFKIADKIALKDEEDKYDLKLFWKAFVSVCIKRKTVDDCRAVEVTSKALSKLGIKGVNKQQLFDMWLLDIRKVWM